MPPQFERFEPPPRPWYTKPRAHIAFGITLIVLAVIILFAANRSDDRPGISTTSMITPLIAVNTKTLGDEFGRDPAAAGRKYGGRRIELTSTVIDVSDSQLTLGTTATKSPTTTRIACRLGRLSQSIALKKGAQITVIGTVAGQYLGAIDLDNCVVL
jgi:hypothetical protein